MTTIRVYEARWQSMDEGRCHELTWRSGVQPVDDRAADWLALWELGRFLRGRESIFPGQGYGRLGWLVVNHIQQWPSINSELGVLHSDMTRRQVVEIKDWGVSQGRESLGPGARWELSHCWVGGPRVSRRGGGDPWRDPVAIREEVADRLRAHQVEDRAAATRVCGPGMLWITSGRHVSLAGFLPPPGSATVSGSMP